MVSFFYKIKKNKWLLAMLIIGMVFALFSLSVIAFDVIELIIVTKNAGRLSNAFFGLNIACWVIDAIYVCALIVICVLRWRGKINV